MMIYLHNNTEEVKTEVINHLQFVKVTELHKQYNEAWTDFNNAKLEKLVYIHKLVLIAKWEGDVEELAQLQSEAKELKSCMKDPFMNSLMQEILILLK